MTNHVAKDCRASEAKIRKYKEEQRKKKSVQSLEEDCSALEKSFAEDGFGFICELCDKQGLQEARQGTSDRKLTLRVDSGASVTAVPKRHKAARGYRVWRDSQYGSYYGTASNKKVKDEGMRVLQTKTTGGPQGAPLRLKTRNVDVPNALLSVPEMVDCGHAVVFDKARSFAVHKDSGRTLEFQRNGKGWDLTLELEAPEAANKAAKEGAVRRLAELKDRSEESTKQETFDALRGILDALGYASNRAEVGEDPTVYPFGRRR